jgi:hypothetical protein
MTILKSPVEKPDQIRLLNGDTVTPSVFVTLFKHVA